VTGHALEAGAPANLVVLDIPDVSEYFEAAPAFVPEKAEASWRESLAFQPLVHSPPLTAGERGTDQDERARVERQVGIGESRRSSPESKRFRSAALLQDEAAKRWVCAVTKRAGNNAFLVTAPN
jgi:hypothetical protein